MEIVPIHSCVPLLSLLLHIFQLENRSHSQTPSKFMDPSATWRDVFLAVLALYLFPVLAVELL